MNEKYDAVVVGAGCAGAIMSARLASSGFKVLLLDRRREEELYNDARDLVERRAFDVSGIDPAVAADGSSPIKKLRVVSPDAATSIEISASPFLVINRGLLERALMDRAREAGVELLTQCIAGSAEIDRGRVTGVSTDRGSFPCTLAVGASGLDRVLCRDLRGEWASRGACARATMSRSTGRPAR